VRSAALVLALMIAGGGLWAGMELVPTFRAHSEWRFFVTPVNYISSTASIVAHRVGTGAPARTVIGTDARLSVPLEARKPRVFIVVVGETVRAANWGLNGYERQTTPELAARTVINFRDVTSCGTSTEVSLPCMFSVHGRHDYDEDRIRRTESLLQVLQHAGVSVLWRDNQSGCKGVCDEVSFEHTPDEKIAGLCSDGRCLDEVLLRGLKDRIVSTRHDFLVVLHVLGNHGPAYYQRYPPAFRRWQPTCDTTDIASCSHAALFNTYDNAILYTDHVLAQIIDMLAGINSRDTGLLYVSDHGESLGEHNLYLHGMPYAIAPKEQTKVPMIVWLSPGLSASAGLKTDCIAAHTFEPVSHDYLFHTVLGIFGVRSSVYDPAWDIAQKCRMASIVKAAPAGQIVHASKHAGLHESRFEGR
jgi:lipid A ethanolaminephosphotransferase